jgi:hypothetical protein
MGRWFPNTLVIAEVKRKSPSGEELTKNSFERQVELADRGGDMVSIHTNPIWEGSFTDITRARRLTDKPILAKGFHGTDDEVELALDRGADYVLVVGREPKSHSKRCFIEPLTLLELEQCAEMDCWAVWNSRNLASLYALPGISIARQKFIHEHIPKFLLELWKHEQPTSGKKKESFAEARSRFNGNLCQASNLRTKDDVHPKADAVLVGTHLEEFAASLGVRL